MKKFVAKVVKDSIDLFAKPYMVYVLFGLVLVGQSINAAVESGAEGVQIVGYTVLYLLAIAAVMVGVVFGITLACILFRIATVKLNAWSDRVLNETEPTDNRPHEATLMADDDHPTPAGEGNETLPTTTETTDADDESPERTEG